MILHAEDGLVGQPQPFDRAVVQVAMGDHRIGRQRGFIDRIVVILRGDLHIRRGCIADGLVAAMMAELELVSARTQRQPDDCLLYTSRCV